jgi:hypothetical protein
MRVTTRILGPRATHSTIDHAGVLKGRVLWSRLRNARILAILLVVSATGHDHQSGHDDGARTFDQSAHLIFHRSLSPTSFGFSYTFGLVLLALTQCLQSFLRFSIKQCCKIY